MVTLSWHAVKKVAADVRKLTSFCAEESVRKGEKKTNRSHAAAPLPCISSAPFLSGQQSLVTSASIVEGVSFASAVAWWNIIARRLQDHAHKPNLIRQPRVYVFIPWTGLVRMIQSVISENAK